MGYLIISDSYRLWKKRTKMADFAKIRDVGGGGANFA